MRILWICFPNKLTGTAIVLLRLLCVSFTIFRGVTFSRARLHQPYYVPVRRTRFAMLFAALARNPVKLPLLMPQPEGK